MGVRVGNPDDKGYSRAPPIFEDFVYLSGTFANASNCLIDSTRVGAVGPGSPTVVFLWRNIMSWMDLTC